MDFVVPIECQFRCAPCGTILQDIDKMYYCHVINFEAMFTDRLKGEVKMPH